MATTVSSILSQSKVLAANYLGATWKELVYTLNIAENNERLGYKGYGVRPLEATTAPGVINFYTLDHRFELVLCSTFARKGSDAEAFTVITDLYDKADEIYQNFEASKLNLSGTVLKISNPSLSEPEIIGEKSLIAIREQFIVTYRQAIP